MIHARNELLQHDHFVIRGMQDPLVSDAIGHYLGVSLVDRGILTAKDVGEYIEILADPTATLEAMDACARGAH